MNAEQMRNRTKAFALRIVALVQSLPQTPTCRLIGNQLLRCGTSVGANYRAACRARSQADFIAKMGIVEEEADEVAYWVELFESRSMNLDAGAPILKEADEIVALSPQSKPREVQVDESAISNQQSTIRG